MSLETQKEERRKKIREYVSDLRKMSKSCYDLKGCTDCAKCEDMTECLQGLRNGLGDIAETLAWLIENIDVLDDTICEIAEITQSQGESKGKKSPSKIKDSKNIDTMFT